MDGSSSLTPSKTQRRRVKALAGAGLGFIDVYDIDGVLLSRFASQGTLNAPWGMAVAPADFGRFGGALLVGNDGDGHINAYDPTSGAFLGQLALADGAPIAIPDLWALTFGNGHEGGNAQTLFFSAGVDYEAHGLFGAIQPPQLRGADTAGTGLFDPTAAGEVSDYPLPPVVGPAFQSPSTPAHSEPVLLPLTESSMALIPTLSTVSQRGPTSAILPNTLAAQVATPHATVVRFIPDASALPRSNANNTVALNSFLDLNAAPNAVAEAVLLPPVIVHVDAVGNDSPQFADVPHVESAACSEGIEDTPATSPPAPPERADARHTGILFEAYGIAWTKMLSSLLCVIAARTAWSYLLDPNRGKSQLPTSPT